MDKKSKYAIIVAGGVGSRSGDSLPKQFHVLAGHPMLWWTLKAFHDEDPETRLIVVMHSDFIDFWKEICGDDCAPHTLTAGGASRKDSVAAGLALIPEESRGLVAVHDAARPLASQRLIREGWIEAERHGAVLPGVPVSDSLRKGTADDNRSVDRSLYYSVQTPQVFSILLLKEAYRKSEEATDIVFTDDASVAEWAGNRIHIYDGDPINIKVTYPGDFRIAADILQNLNPLTR
ncbi:MAG: 2-C-methyl-D-erythritol 4-phosphate cytidylyltransferase [Muribaculaceae bacterium]|nr:2-C-methyl-D-erythritol 4-phosphate cytidylyltransferase [Muribaculaceae bacterium]